jgi:ubiquinone biosynthesis protein
MRALAHLWRLARAGRTLAAHDALAAAFQGEEIPGMARALVQLAKLGYRRGEKEIPSPLAAALVALGPSYIKLGQFLATRSDIVGEERARDLSLLQDRLQPFSQGEALKEIRSAFGVDATSLFAEFGPPVAAASIAQVHRAVTREGREVAVKILRPGIEKRFAQDVQSFLFAARLLERWHKPAKRLRPVEAVETLERSVALEMDLRMEAAAIAEMGHNVKDDPSFRVPEVDWTRTARRVLTTNWIEGIPLSDVDRLRQGGHDPDKLAEVLIQSFLKHAIHDGFFHADMHQGNLFVDATGRLVAVDFGIMGRLSPKDRRFLAEILYGFITRNYAHVAQVHFDAGYVPPDQEPMQFAQALRAIGEPLMDKTAEDISMARLLTQLFQVTEQFSMQTQPQLLLLQKTMVVVEGVARSLNPRLNMWTTAEPVVRDWVEAKLGPQGRLEEAAESALTLGRLVTSLPEVFSEAQRAAHLLSDMAQGGGIRLDRQTTETLARAQAEESRKTQIALWIGAIALAVLALTQVF